MAIPVRTTPHVHAEESALGKLPAGDPRLASATIYSTRELLAAQITASHLHPADPRRWHPPGRCRAA